MEDKKGKLLFRVKGLGHGSSELMGVDADNWVQGSGLRPRIQRTRRISLYPRIWNSIRTLRSKCACLGQRCRVFVLELQLGDLGMRSYPVLLL